MARILPIARSRFETAESPFWISYADLMTALVMLFMVVMSLSMITIAVQAMEEKKAREEEKRQRETEIQEVMAQLEKESGNRALDITINRNAHTISFGGKARFALNSYQLNEEAKKSLRAFVPLLLEARQTETGGRWLKRVHIEGYTDESGTYLYNVNLSLNRAQAVVCTMMAAELNDADRRRLREMLIIDGATVTSIKSTPEESRRVEVRLEFRTLGDDEQPLPVPDMTLGNCVIPLQNTKE